MIAPVTSELGGERVMIKRVTCAAIIFCIVSSANAATVRFKSYTTPEDEKQRILNAVYLDGLKDGLIILNVALARKGAAPLFCLPPKMALTGDQADDILRREAKSVPEPDEMPIGIVLLAGLRKTFPCEGQSK
jgi:Rap1a immunity proteins